MGTQDDAPAAADGVASSTLERPAAGAEQDGMLVRARVTNAHGTTVTATATLTVAATQPPVVPVEPGQPVPEAPDSPVPGPDDGAAVPSAPPTGEGTSSGQAGAGQVGVRPQTGTARAGSLAETGTSPAQAVAGALGLGLLGAAAVVLARRRERT